MYEGGFGDGRSTKIPFGKTTYIMGLKESLWRSQKGLKRKHLHNSKKREKRDMSALENVTVIWFEGGLGKRTCFPPHNTEAKGAFVSPLS